MAIPMENSSGELFQGLNLASHVFSLLFFLNQHETRSGRRNSFHVQPPHVPRMAQKNTFPTESSVQSLNLSKRCFQIESVYAVKGKSVSLIGEAAYLQDRHMERKA